jgi:hypothetical protein
VDQPGLPGFDEPHRDDHPAGKLLIVAAERDCADASAGVEVEGKFLQK